MNVKVLLLLLACSLWWNLASSKFALKHLAFYFRSYLTEHIVLWGGVVSPMSNPQPEAPEYSFMSGSSFWPVWHEIPYQFLHYRQHSSQDHLATHAPPLHQSREGNIYLEEYIIIWLCNVYNTASTSRKCIVIHNDVIWGLTTTMIFIQISMCLISPTRPKS